MAGQRALSSLLLKAADTSDPNSSGESIIECTSNQLQATDRDASAKYLDIRLLLPTSNLCERLFSIAGYALTNRQKDILPINLGSQLFSFMNRETYGVLKTSKRSFTSMVQ